MLIDVKGTIKEILYEGSCVCVFTIITESEETLMISANPNKMGLSDIIPGETYNFKCGLFAKSRQTDDGKIIFKNIIVVRQMFECGEGLRKIGVDFN